MAPDPDVRLLGAAGWGLVGTISLVVGAITGGRSFDDHLPGAWFFGMPGGPLGSWGTYALHPPIYAIAAVYGGLILLTRSWFRLLRQLRDRPGVPVKKVLLVIALWSVPLLLAPPLFSKDAYSYAGQGEMVSYHIDPYTYGTAVLGTTPFSTMPDKVWANTPTPYGPTFLTVDGLLVDASGHRILPDLVLLRLLELAGLALAAAATPTLARALRRDPAEAMVLGIGSPLVLVTLIAGAHNDALMMGLLLAGLAVARRIGTVPGIVLCALATGVKSPAALGILFLGWLWAGPGASFWRRAAHTTGALLIGVVTLAAVSAASGVGWGWLRTNTAADRSFTGVSPMGAISRLVSDVGQVIRVPIPVLSAHAVVSVIGLLVATAIGIRMLLLSPSRDLQTCLGVTLLVVALLGPVLWGWYATWGVLVLAPAVTPRLRRVIMGICTYEVFVGVTSLVNIGRKMVHTAAAADLAVLALLIALAVVPIWPTRPPLTGAGERRPEPEPVLASLTA
jgi:hypothetical protein